MAQSGFRICLLIAGLLVFPFIETVKGAAGGSIKTMFYYTSVRRGDDTSRSCVFSIEIDRIVFSLNSVQSKYKVVPVKIVNASPAALQLSRREDAFDLRLENRKISGILDLANADKAMWDAFDHKMRETLDYPESVDKGQTLIIYVFFKKPQLAQLPTLFEFSVKSLGRTIEIAQPPAVAARN